MNHKPAHPVASFDNYLCGTLYAELLAQIQGRSGRSKTIGDGPACAFSSEELAGEIPA
ncbi:hypothetical protein GCM10010530_07520 [Kribbella aluminosa]